MSAKVTIRREAKTDLLQHFTYIGEQNYDAAVRFLKAAQSDMQKLAEMPGMGACREFDAPDLAGIRSWPVGGFRNYLIFYKQRPDGISVLAVLHGARDI